MKKHTLSTIIFCLIGCFIYAQNNNLTDESKEKKESSPLSVFKMRSVGPAFCSGRIADIAIHPDNENHWYVAVGSGGVWETKNGGVTWKPIFDDKPSYSTGCITIDPNNHSTIWLGTGENVGGRHVAYGDGVYKSNDAGATWKNMGLKASEHISKIIVHPTNANVVYVAAQGPLWSKGGERGLYKTVDGGTTWKHVLGDNEWVGVTDLLMDPRDPDLMYAATWQRHRTVAAYMGGGPGSGIHRSRDGGETWQELKGGIPTSNLGKIGLALSHQKPDELYAAIELDRTTGGVFKSFDQGDSWKKMSDAVSGATGPHYYQELYACPHNYDRLYLMDVRIQVSDNGGKNFRRLNESNKHSDNHSINFRKDDPNYLLVGSDGGIYESLDLAETWRFMDNLPLTQYYKVAVDDRKPFYHIFGGTQDNGSHGGPSATDDRSGIRNADWYKTLGADGHQSATEPGNPNIIYAETQQGGMHRVDLKTGEQVFIQPQAGAGEPYERFNWDAPIIVSPHDPATLLFASQRVWKSTNRGDSWTAISGDLSRNEERLGLKIMGNVQSWDNPWDVGAMSNYNSITSLAQSPLNADLIYAGTDDGIIQVTEDGGKFWRKTDVSSLPGAPERAFVNDIKADLHDPNTVYVAMDNHKQGDFQPYLYKSINRGATWTSISNNIPDRTLVWRVVQDHVDGNIMFAATEFGIYATLDGGAKWEKLKGTPTISFRDLVIQKRENDLVAASFGRGFYVLDDYSAMRNMSKNFMADNQLLTGRDAKLFVYRNQKGNRGAELWTAKNPDFGAQFVYNVTDEFVSQKSARKKAEKKLAAEGKDVPFQGWDALLDEKQQAKPMLWFTIKDDRGAVVRKISAPAKQGVSKVSWDLRHASQRAINPNQRGGNNSWRARFNRGHMASPGSYTVSMAKEVNGVVTELVGPQSFNVEMLQDGTIEGASAAEYQRFAQELNRLRNQQSAISSAIRKNKSKLGALATAVERASIDAGPINEEMYEIRKKINQYDKMLNGNPIKEEIGERNDPTISNRLRVASRALSTTYGPTELHRESLKIARLELNEITPLVQQLDEEDMPALERKLQQAGAPYIEGQAIPAMVDRP